MAAVRVNRAAGGVASLCVCAIPRRAMLGSNVSTPPDYSCTFWSLMSRQPSIPVPSSHVGSAVRTNASGRQRWPPRYSPDSLIHLSVAGPRIWPQQLTSLVTRAGDEMDVLPVVKDPSLDHKSPLSTRTVARKSKPDDESSCCCATRPVLNGLVGPPRFRMMPPAYSSPERTKSTASFGRSFPVDDLNCSESWSR